MKKWMVLGFALVILLAACSGGSQRIAEIKQDGVLRVGVKVDVPFFGFINAQTGENEGFEIDLARAIAKSILGDEAAVRFVPVTALTRETLLANNDIDIVIATFTITEERKKTQSFSTPYYVDEIGFLVRKDSEIFELEDLKGKVMGATRSSTAYNEFVQHPETLGGDFTLRSFASYPEMHSALLLGDIDVFATDKSIIYGYLSDATMLLTAGVNPQQYGIATRLADKDLTKHIDNLLKEMTESGALDEIRTRWLQK